VTDQARAGMKPSQRIQRDCRVVSPSQSGVASGKRIIYTAGQVSIDKSGALMGAGDLAAQTAQGMRNVGLALAAAGATYADIEEITTYVVNYQPEHRAAISKARASFFANGTPPASTLVGVAALAPPEWLVEIEALPSLIDVASDDLSSQSMSRSIRRRCR
jgi:enamine deaminase RidA (YjgF/YER057c/UK114 family)